MLVVQAWGPELRTLHLHQPPRLPITPYAVGGDRILHPSSELDSEFKRETESIWKVERDRGRHLTVSPGPHVCNHTHETCKAIRSTVWVDDLSFIRSHLMNLGWGLVPDSQQSETALSTPLPFCTACLCEAAFSALAVIKSKCQSTLKNVQNALQPAASFSPDLIFLCKTKQTHLSHWYAIFL